MSNEGVTTENLTDHSYDGIQEYDNPLPGWWVWLFNATIFFSIFYVVFYHMGATGRSIHDDFDRQSAKIFAIRFKEIGELEPNRETMISI